MSTKASLETLARTMSIAFLCLAVVAVGKEQASPSNAVEEAAAPTVAPIEKKILDTNPQQTLKDKRTEIVKKKASRSRVPSNLEKRGIWLKELLKEAGFKGDNLKEAWAVVMKESRGNPLAHNDNAATGDNSYGLFQINMIGDLGPDRRAKFNLKSNKDLFDPLTNAQAAHYMSDGGKNWRSWDIDSSGYNGGVSEQSYRYWLTQYPKG